MATDTNETATDAQDDENVAGGQDDKSQEEMAAEFEAEKEKQYAESRRKIMPLQLASTVVLVVIALGCLYLGSSVTGNHPLVENVLDGAGVLNLVAAGAIQFRANWSRTIVLILMPLTVGATIITFTNTTKGAFLVALLCVVEIFLMFRRPVLDEYDAPKE